jgi:ankyrin repeat protein
LQAVAKGDIGAVRLLLDNDADIESKDDHGDTPLIIAIENRDTVRLL